MMQDFMTSAQATMSTDHAYIHLERGFGLAIATASLAHTTGVERSVFKTPAAVKRKAIHLRVPGFSAAASLMKLAIYEDAANSSGTARPIYNHFRKENPKVSDSQFLQAATVAATTKALNTAAAGGNFANQPANDTVSVLSDDNTATDKGQIVTIWGTLHGADNTVVSATATLNGTTAVDFTGAWGKVLGVEMSAAAAGTVTIREKSASQTITTLSATETSAGIVTITDDRGRDQIITAVGSAATTKFVGMMGRKADGTATTWALALTGDTPVNVGAVAVRWVDKLLIGDVESARTVTFTRPAVKLFEILAGSGGGVQSNSGGQGSGGVDEWILEAGTDYIVEITNIGGSAASIGYLTMFWYEEAY